MYGENPFLTVNSKLFFPSCQSLILIFSKFLIGIFNAMGGTMFPLHHSIAGDAEDAKTAAGEAEPVS